MQKESFAEREQSLSLKNKHMIKCKRLLSLTSVPVFADLDYFQVRIVVGWLRYRLQMDP